MPNSPGDKIGPYEVVALLGKGGMGEVYRARDPKLNREVAIKVLPPALANDADFVARFQREAQTLAALNHPNIAAIYGLEGNAIVMELVEGETLQGPLPIEAALPLAKQIAEALEAAHEKAIIHRDLKPGNVRVTPEGVVKVLDFGLAKSVSERPVATGPDSPTLTLRATEAGLILGTAGYMSPEQAAGKSVDRRADIWAFGVVLHELLTGKRLFEGETVTHTLADVVKGDIDFSALPEGSIRELVKRCLDRNIKTRLQHIGEARIALDNYAPLTAKAEPTKTSYWPWVIAAAGVLAAVVVWVARPAPPVLLTSRSAITAPPDTTFEFRNGLGLPAISPDGRRLVFGARQADGKTPLWVRPLDALTAQPLAGTDGATFPFWSPDSKFIGFFADGKLRKIDAGGGPVITLTDASSGRGGSWSTQGVIVFTPEIEGGSNVLHRVSAAGGKSTLLTQGRFPHFLPDGVHFLHHGHDDTRARDVAICVGSVEGGPCREIMRAQSTVSYALGHLLYLRDGTLMAHPFDAKSFALTGDAVPIAERVQATLSSRFAGVFTVSNNGILVYREGGAARAASLLSWIDRAGKVEGAVGDPAIFVRAVSLSPDQKKLAVSIVDGTNSDLWTIDVAKGLRTRLTFDAANEQSPVWSPDGRMIAFASNRKGHFDIYRKPANGMGAEELLYADEFEKYPTSWSPDGNALLFESARNFRRT